jgi:hypothetical protein
MDDRRVPNLEAMDEEEATRLLTQLASALSPEGEYQIRHPEDYVMEMPQSGERLRGRENVKAFQAAFIENSTPPSIRIRRVLVRELGRRCGSWRASWTTVGGSSPTGWPSSNSKTARYGGTPATSPSFSTRRGGGLIWSSGWRPRSGLN